MAQSGISRGAVSVIVVSICSQALCAIDIISPDNGPYEVFLDAIENTEFIVTSSVPWAHTASVGSDDYVKLEAQGGTTPYTWDVQGLPEGMSIATGSEVLASYPPSLGTLQADDVVLVGTPAPGSSQGGSLGDGVHYLKITVTDANGDTDSTSLARVAVHPPFSIVTTELPKATTQYSYGPVVLDITGGLAPYNWEPALTNVDDLVPGLTIRTDTYAVGTYNSGAIKYKTDVLIEGAPYYTVASGTYTVTLAVIQSALVQTYASVDLELEVEEGVLSWAIAMPDATVGVGYGPETASIDSEFKSLQPFTTGQATGVPAGMSFAVSSSGDVVLGGRPTVAANDPYTVRFNLYSADSFFVVTASVEIKVLPAPLNILTVQLPRAYLGQSYAVDIHSIGGIAPVTWSAQGLPDGIGIETDPLSGQVRLVGTPTAEEASQYAVTLNVTDSSSTPVTEVAKYLMLVSDTPSAKFSIRNTYLPPAIEGESYGPLFVEVDGGTKPFSWSSPKGLPDGIVLIANSDGRAVLQGEVAPGTPATKMMMVQLAVKDATGEAASAIYPLVVRSNASATTTNDPDSSDSEAPSAPLNTRLVGAATAACSLTPSQTINPCLAIGGLLALLSIFRKWKVRAARTSST